MDDVERAAEFARIALKKDVLLAVYNARVQLWHMVQAADLAGVTLAAIAFGGQALSRDGLVIALTLGGFVLAGALLALQLDERGLEEGYHALQGDIEKVKGRAPR